MNETAAEQDLYRCDHSCVLDSLCGQNHDPKLRKFANECYLRGVSDGQPKQPTVSDIERTSWKNRVDKECETVDRLMKEVARLDKWDRDLWSECQARGEILDAIQKECGGEWWYHALDAMRKCKEALEAGLSYVEILRTLQAEEFGGERFIKKAKLHLGTFRFSLIVALDELGMGAIVPPESRAGTAETPKDSGK